MAGLSTVGGHCTHWQCTKAEPQAARRHFGDRRATDSGTRIPLQTSHFKAVGLDSVRRCHLADNVKRGFGTSFLPLHHEMHWHWHFANGITDFERVLVLTGTYPGDGCSQARLRA